MIGQKWTVVGGETKTEGEGYSVNAVVDCYSYELAKE